jgi:2-polyprenyl-3-methyl-5-hydroxy-6-metoxy-1,4-benzoquinol methylase
MKVECLLCKDALTAFHNFSRKALFNKPLRSPLPDATTEMALGYCERCRHISSATQPPPAYSNFRDKIYGELYEHFAPTSISLLQQEYTVFVSNWLSDFLGPESRILEVGCHDGFFLELLSQRGHKCHGVEPSPFAEIARTKPGLSIVRGFYKSDYFEKGSYDLVVAKHVVEHVADPVAFVRDISVVVKDGGYAYFEVPNSYISLEQGYFPEFHVDHISYFTSCSLAKLLHLCGFSVVVHLETVYAYMKFPFINVLVRKGNKSTPAPGSPGQRWFQDFLIRRIIDRFCARYPLYVERLRKLTSNGTLGVWGAGSCGTQYAIDAGWSRDRVVFVDPNPSNQGLFLSVTGHPVCPPESLNDIELASILIASGWEQDVITQIRAALPRNVDVMTFSDLIR